MFSVLIRTLTILSLCGLLVINGCRSENVVKNPVSGAYSYEVVGSAIAVDFGPDGRLWRLIPTADAVYVDYSDDQGQSFSAPVPVHLPNQQMNAWPENPPAIKVSQSGSRALLCR